MWCTDRGVVDVAYLLEFGMKPEQRKASEMALLKVYHATLLECGVGDYDFERCVHD